MKLRLVSILLFLLMTTFGCSKNDSSSLGHSGDSTDVPAGQQASSTVLFADYPPSSAIVEQKELAGGVAGQEYTLLAPEETGIDFIGLASSRELRLDNLGSQAGLAAADYDGDGDIDLYICGIENDNQLFRNDGGFRFTDVTDEANPQLGIPGELAGSAVFFDVNGDYLLDLYVAVRSGANRLFVSNGDGTFIESAASHGLDSERSTIVSAVFDIDNDGDLDVYNANNRKGRNEDDLVEDDRSDTRYFGFLLNKETGQIILDSDSSQDHYMDNAGKIRLRPDNDEMLINDGNGNFRNQASQKGIVPNGWSLNALACDFNNDGWIDLQVSGDFDTPDWYYLNNGKGYFREMGRSMLRINSFFGMGSDAGDLNRDGWMDFVVGDMSASSYKDSKKQSGDMNTFRHELRTYTPHQNMRNTAFINRGDGWMTEAAALLGVKSTDWTWAMRIADLNSDGIHEILATNGYISNTIEYDIQLQLRRMRENGATDEEIEEFKLSLPALLTDDIIFTANEPLEYNRAPGNWGISDGAISCGVILQDLDGDGDLDMVVNHTNEQIGVYRNDIENGNRVLIDLRQEGQNHEAVGARVVAHCGDDQFMQDVILARGYASAESSRIHIGIGDHEKIDALWIRWPGNRAEVLRDLDANRHYTVTQGSDLVDLQPLERTPLLASRTLNWEQEEADTFDAEFEAEPLLPVRRSTLGTGLGVADVNADGMLDVYFAGPAGMDGELYYGRENGTLVSSPMLDSIVDERQENMTALFFEANADGRPDLLLTSGSNELEPGSNYYLDRLLLNEDESYALGRIEAERTSSGSACAGDIDGDGDLDLVIAGRQKPGEYLRPEASHIMVNDGEGGFSVRTGMLAPGLVDVGPISDMLLTDINGDGSQDLVLAVEFGAIEWWAGKDGRLVRQGEISPTGTWQSLACGDFDNDGDTDLLAGNYGLNTKYHPKPGKPYMIIADDFDDNGTRDLVEVKFGSDGTLLPGRGRSCSGYAITTIPERFPTWAMFADASLEDIYGPLEEVAEQYTADTVESVLLLNDGDGGFSMQPLPLEAQYSIVFGMAVGDFDNDGNLDAWLNQNYRNTQPEETRWVSSYGCMLLGDGSGGFRALSHMESGMLVNAEGRGAVAADMNADGCLDLLVSVSNGSPQVGYGSEERCKGRGLLVSLAGPAGNPAGVGAKLSLELSDGRMLHREVLAGHTYLSSYVGPMHFGIPTGTEPVKLSVQWPGGGSSELTDIGEVSKVIVTTN